MPYYLFEVNPFKQLSYLDSFANYRDAKQRARDLRSSRELTAGTSVRMMFATNRDEAERLLKEKREPRPMGEHD